MDQAMPLQQFGIADPSKFKDTPTTVIGGLTYAKGPSNGWPCWSGGSRRATLWNCNEVPVGA